MKYQNVKDAIKALREGKLILVMDDKDRENEGDLICSAEHATTENVNFMATHAKGLICIPMSGEIAKTTKPHSQCQSTIRPRRRESQPLKGH